MCGAVKDTFHDLTLQSSLAGQTFVEALSDRDEADCHLVRYVLYGIGKGTRFSDLRSIQSMLDKAFAKNVGQCGKNSPSWMSSC